MSETSMNTSDLFQALGSPSMHDISGVPAVALPPGYKLELHEALLPEPRRIRQFIVAHEVGGFISYVNRFKSAKAAIYCAGRSSPKLAAVLDDDQPGEPSHRTHTCAFPCPLTLEWSTWIAADKKPMAQVEFAEFLERNLREIAEPNGADMLTAVLSFQDTGRAEFRSAVRLNDGRVQFQFIEKEDAGEIKFPSTLKVALPVFEGNPDRYAISARLRYRIKEGQLTIWYEMDRPDLVLRAAYEDLLTLVETQTGIGIHRAI